MNNSNMAREGKCAEKLGFAQESLEEMKRLISVCWEAAADIDRRIFGIDCLMNQPCNPEPSPNFDDNSLLGYMEDITRRMNMLREILAHICEAV